MSKRTKPKKAEVRGDFLRPWGPPLRSERLDVPGWEGEHPLFPFVLMVANGKKRKVLREHLRLLLQFDLQRFPPDADEACRAIHRPEILDYAVMSMVEIMRLAADLWIDSGKSLTDPDVDTPSDRNVEVVLPGRGFSLFHLFWNRLFCRFPQFTGMFRDGSQGIEKKWPRFEPNDLQMGLKASLEDYGARIALYYFADLLNSGDSHRIARCDHCKKYFAYERARLRTVKNGVFCPSHGGKGAARRTVASRTKRLETAARACLKWESKRSGQPDSQWIADHVNESHGTAFGRRWVSQNLEKIQERVEALRYAKS